MSKLSIIIFIQFILSVIFLLSVENGSKIKSIKTFHN